MKSFTKVLDSLNIRYHTALTFESERPLILDCPGESNNLLIQLTRGNIFAGNAEIPLKEGSFYFIPAGHAYTLRFGNPEKYVRSSNGGLGNKEVRERHFQPVSRWQELSRMKNVFTVVEFEAMIYDVISFFTVLELPCFQIPYDEEISHLVKHIALEEEQNKLGRNRLIKNYTQEIVLQLCRYINKQTHFQEHVNKINFLLEERLITIIEYIHKNLQGELTNKVLAQVACVSEDYVGQFFKTRTGQTLQVYIEDQRLQKAKGLISFAGMNVQQAAFKSGFKDAAYFSRRFKLKFGENAAKLKNPDKAHTEKE